MANNQLVEQLKRHEGFRSKPYLCTAGKATIGYGRNLDDVGLRVSEASTMLKNDIAYASASAERFLDGVRLSEPRFSVVVNMAFNLGESRLFGFRKFKAALAKGDFDEAANQMLNSRWAEQVGSRAIELAKQMRQGAWDG